MSSAIQNLSNLLIGQCKLRDTSAAGHCVHPQGDHLIAPVEVCSKAALKSHSPDSTNESTQADSSSQQAKSQQLKETRSQTSIDSRDNITGIDYSVTGQ